MKKYNILLLLLLIIQQFGISQSKDLVTIKERVIEELFLIKPDDKAIETILSKLNDDGSFNDIKKCLKFIFIFNNSCFDFVKS